MKRTVISVQEGDKSNYSPLGLAEFFRVIFYKNSYSQRSLCSLR